MQNSHEDALQIVEEKNIVSYNVGNNGMQRFIASGVRDQKFFEKLNKKVQDLGGNIVKTDVFVNVINNVLAWEFNASEKILGALAAGHWILKVDYVIDSSKARCWLNKEDYEWASSDEIAKYCRLRRNTRGQGMFAGWTVYIYLESGKRRSYTRIIRGGGGKVYATEDLRRKLPDFVIVEKRFVKEARELVGPEVPLVNTNFISGTLLMKRDPMDIKPYIIDTEKITDNEVESRLMGDVQQGIICDRRVDIRKVDSPLLSQECSKWQVSESGLLSLKRPYKVGEVTRNDEKTSPSKQPCRGNFLSDIRVPVKSRSDSPSDSPRKKRNKKHKFSSEKYLDIRSFCIMKDSNAKRSESVDSDDSDIVMVNEDPSGVTSDRANSSVINLQSFRAQPKQLNTGGFLNKKAEEKENVYRPSSITSVGNEFDGSSGHASRVNDISESDVMVELGRSSLLDTDDGKVTSRIDQTHKNQNQISEDCEKTVKDLANLYAGSSSGIGKNIKDLSNFSVVVTVSPMDHKRCNEIENLNRREMVSALECLEINDTGEDFKTDEPSDLSQFSTSTSSSGSLYFNSGDIKSAVMTLVKKQTMSCSTLTKFIQPCYPDRSDVSVVVIDDKLCEPEENCTEFVLEETAFFEESTDEDVTRAEVLDAADQETIVDGIESLFLHISLRKYPPAWVMGRILSQLALKVDSEFVHQRAINLAYQILTLHPPNITNRRTYYYTILTLGIQGVVDHHNRAWLFVQDVIKSALKLKAVGGETPNEACRARVLLQFLLTLLQQDFLMWDRRFQNVSSLITVRLFWGQSKNLKFITQNIKDLMKLWVESLNSTPDVQSCLGGLVSVLLEVVVAGSNIIPVVGDQVLLTPYIPQIATYIQHLDVDSKTKLVGNLSSPWVRSLVLRSLLSKIHNESNQELAETDLKALLCKSKNVEFVSQATAEEKVCKTNDERSEQSSTKTKGRKNINKRNTRGETQLVRACATNNIALVKKCLATPGVDVNLPDNAGWTAMHEAALHGHVQCVKLLLEFIPPPSSFNGANTLKGVNLHLKGDGDHTALHDAVENGHYEIAELLLEHGGEGLLYEKTTEGETPLDCAKTSAMAKLLKTYIGNGSLNNSSYFSVSPRKRKFMPVRVAIQQEDYSKLLVAAVNSYVTHMGLMSIYRHLYAIAKGKTSKASDDLILCEEIFHGEGREQRVVEKLFPIIQSDLAVILNSKCFLHKIDLPKAKDLLMFSLSR